jgi:hypothetical protein
MKMFIERSEGPLQILGSETASEAQGARGPRRGSPILFRISQPGLALPRTYQTLNELPAPSRCSLDYLLHIVSGCSQINSKTNQKHRVGPQEAEEDGRQVARLRIGILRATHEELCFDGNYGA